MQYRKFGKLDWKASVLGFGCMRLPIIDGDSGNIDQEKTNKMLWTAIDGGINYFDTAYLYHKGQSEVALGKALKNGYREKVRIATKLPVRIMHETEEFDTMLNEELKRLQTDTIDFYLLHALNKANWEKTQKLGLLEKAEAALADGRIKHLGFSFHDKLDVFKTIIDGYDKWTFCQIQYNYMDIDYQAGKAGLQYAANKDLAVVVMEPLRGGRLAVDLPAASSIWKKSEYERTPADRAFQWVWNQPEVTLALSGMNTLEQVEENLVSAHNAQVDSLSEKELTFYDQARKVLLGLSPIDCTSCEYCMPCPSGVNIPWMLELYNRAAIFDDLEGTRNIYEKFVSDKVKAMNCIQCGECLDKCPQNIPISDWMPVIEDVLGNNQPYQQEP